jgi:hypothetical protein
MLGNERRMHPKSKVTHRWSKTTTSRWIRPVHEDLRAHQSTQTDSRQAHTDIYDMGAHLAAFWPKTGPNGASPRSADHHGRPTMWWRPTGPTDSQWQVVSHGWCSMAVWLHSWARGRWFPPINTNGGGTNENTLHTSHHNIFSWVLTWVRVVLGSLGVEVLRRGAGNGALL